MQTYTRPQPRPGRLAIMLLGSLAAIGLICVRLFVLQVVSHDYYEALATSQHEHSEELVAKRGKIMIYDRYSGEPYVVAASVNRPTVAASPSHITDPQTTAQVLSEKLQLDYKEVFDKVSDTGRKYVVVAREVPEEITEELSTMNMSGITFENSQYRDYPEDTLSAHVLGFWGFDADHRVGRYGIEQQFEKQLAGTPGLLAGARDLGGNWITSGQRDFTPAVDGSDIFLTIDRAIQHTAEQALARAVESYRGKGGSVIVLNPKNGAVLAMASYPTFNPNNYGEVSDLSAYNNSAIQAPYEPGSVMKAITMAAALNEGAITPDMEFEDPGFIDLENFTIRNANSKVFGKVNMTEVLNESINTGLVFTEQRLGHKKFQEYLEKFGFGAKTRIELPFESGGDISNLDRGGDLYPATISFGQGMTATPLQLAAAYAAIANGGILYKPWIVARTVDPDGNETMTDPQKIQQVIAPGTATTLGAMMVSVVEQGHGKRAGVPGYFIAGKTGTAQIAYQDRAGYDPNRTVGTFAGFGPIDNPVFAMVVRIDEPQGVQFAESTAAPTFGEIAAFILNYYQVPKTR